MKQNLLAAVGALALTWQTAAAADPVAVDAPMKLPEVKTTAALAGATMGSAPASVKDGPTQVGAVAPAPEKAAPAAGCGLPCLKTVWGDPACCQQCCNQCCDACGCGGGGRVIGGLGLYVIQPYFANNPAFTVTRSSSTGSVVESTDRTDLRHSMDVAPELWLGYVSDSGMGGRLRWWYFRQGTNQSLSFAPGTAADNITVETGGPLGITVFGDNIDRAAAIAATSKLQLQVWDLEGLYQQQWAGWDLLFSGGLRLAHINQHFNAYFTGAGDQEDPISVNLQSGHSFHGVGPTIALEGHRSLGDTGLGVFGTMRTALLFGSAKQTVLDAFTPGADPTEFAFAQDHRTRVLPVAELELGVEYAQNVGAGRAFGQIALVGQNWFGAGNASRSTQDNSLGIPNGASIIDNDLGFFGFVVRAGVNY